MTRPLLLIVGWGEKGIKRKGKCTPLTKKTSVTVGVGVTSALAVVRGSGIVGDDGGKKETLP